MSTIEALNETNDQEYNEKDLEETNSRYYRLLKAENERYQQEVHDIKKKLELYEVMLREIQEANELLERNYEEDSSKTKKVVGDTKERLRVITAEYENTIADLETKSAAQEAEIQRLNELINQQKKTESAQITEQSENVSLEADNVALRERVDQLTAQLREEERKCRSAEETIEDLRVQCTQLQQNIRDIRDQLHEHTTNLEEAQAIIASTRAEVGSRDLNETPTNASSKGNSLFAEIEDRRRDMVNKTNALYRKYAEVKRTCALQMAEIIKLKKERVSALGEWENNAGNVSAEMQELLQKYKNRVTDLERKLKSEIKNNQSDQENVEPASFVYYQSLVAAKKKEIDELRVKIEDLSTHLLVQEEAKMHISIQLRRSQYKVSCLEAEIQVLQGKFKLSLQDNANTEEQLKKDKDCPHTDDNNVTVPETRVVPAQREQNTVAVLQGEKDKDILDSMKTEETTDRDVIETQIPTSSDTCKTKSIKSENKDKNTRPVKTVHFSTNIIHIPTNANIE